MELFQNPKITLVVVPFFLAAILIEALIYPRWRGRAYPWREGGLSILIGLGHAMAGFVNQAVVIGLIAAGIWHIRIFTMPMDQWWAWILLFVLEEFAYYWYHRSAHVTRLLWASHSVHHSPNELTLASAYRLSWTPILSATWLFFMPLVLVGFHPLVIFTLLSINLAYQFWLHSTLIPRLGPLEAILNTPSSHRVHHATHPDYLDKNFGGVVIVFDRLFGTYKAEDPNVPLVYGLVTPVTTRNPLRIVYGEFVRLARDLWRARSWRTRGELVVKPPGWVPPANA
jgi:sterol desaturase/sphingolipid hydroxylase (fatty acid hydroxylase superfamily)